MFVVIYEKDGEPDHVPKFVARLAGSGENYFPSRTLREALYFRQLESAKEIEAAVPGTRVHMVQFIPLPK